MIQTQFQIVLAKSNDAEALDRLYNL